MTNTENTPDLTDYLMCDRCALDFAITTEELATASPVVIFGRSFDLDDAGRLGSIRDTLRVIKTRCHGEGHTR